MESKEFYEMARVGYQTVANNALASVASLSGLISRMDHPETCPAPVLHYPRRGRPPMAKTHEAAAPEPRKPANYQQPKRARKPLSAKARKAIASAQRKRWAAHREAKKAAKK